MADDQVDRFLLGIKRTIKNSSSMRKLILKSMFPNVRKKKSWLLLMRLRRLECWKIQ